MNALLLGLLLAQSTAEVRIVVSIAKPRCFVVDAGGDLRPVSRGAAAGRSAAACAIAPADSPPKVEQRVEVAATPTTPEQRVIEFIFLP